MIRLYRATYKVKGDGHERGMTYEALCDAQAVRVARDWELEDKLKGVEFLRTKQQLLMEV
jgi:hypothetical protein